MSTERETFRWSDAYSVNIAVLDAQHRKLIAIVNQLDQALRTGHGGTVVDTVLAQLVNYAFEHFATEESLMKQHQYPGLSTHREHHEEFRERMTEFLEAQRAAKPCVPVSVMLYLEPWLKEHLLKTDQQYSAYLNARGVY
ncbi:MAG TPA: bacteriohemerythrin [Candidatus Sulfotelmatobacter sp.]|nr:bacteriohemerythrin [Candidatus Sulfotelmatobacter sp.]